MNKLDDLYRIADFNINMCTIFASQIEIVRHHSCVIQMNISIVHTFHSDTIVLTSSVQRIIVDLNYDFDLIRL